jgi:quinone-modifying oxidoreductase, subunit QmoA
MNDHAKPILVIGGGIAGMTAAVEAAEVGHRVVLVEKESYLGGRVLRMHRYFPKMCPPSCGFEINVRRIRRNPRITVHTLATVEEITGSVGDFRAIIRVAPRYVTGECSLDDRLTDALESERDDAFNYGMSKTKALYRPLGSAYPAVHVLDREALSDADAAMLAEASPPGSIDLDMQESTIKVDVGAVIVATGWRPYDAALMDNLGYGAHPNVITNVIMERLASGDGPTGGEIVRPSDGKKAMNVAFVQCAGSRDENHLAYCSGVCCMASLKHARYLREKNEDARVTIFYIDVRTVGRFEKFYYDMLDDPNLRFVKGKVAKVESAPENDDLAVSVEDTLSRETLHETFDMVVLATGMVPNTKDAPIPLDVTYDDYGFIEGDAGVKGVFAAGCTGRPCDVSRASRDATAAALSAIQCVNGEG